jgi:GNAT superfamily N-acetyltransferase
VQVRKATEADIAQLVNLQFEVYPPPDFPPVNRWGASQLELHQQIFPEGQLVAALDGRIVGAATTMVVAGDEARRPHTFRGITGGAGLANHDASADALYGVDILVSPHFRRRGIARALYEARFALQARLGLASFYAGARIPGFAAVRDSCSPERYLREVRTQERYDPTLSRQLQLGFEAVCLLPRYLPDPETADYAVLIQRDLPRALAGVSPGRPPVALEQTRAARGILPPDP